MIRSIPQPEIKTQQLERIRTLAWYLDSSFQIPGTKWRFGLEALFGLIPGIGDFVGALFSIYIVIQAYRLGFSKSLLLRMLGNIAVESLAGTVPVMGDLFDFVWKANQRNMALMDLELREPAKVQKQTRIMFLIGAVFLLIATSVPVVLFAYFLRFIIQRMA